MADGGGAEITHTGMGMDARITTGRKDNNAYTDNTEQQNLRRNEYRGLLARNPKSAGHDNNTGRSSPAWGNQLSP
jgi:predicted phage gp36 major capsid-like protein